MDKHKQYTENVHPIGATIDPAPSIAMPASAATSKVPFTFSNADLASDFSTAVDPGGAHTATEDNSVVAAPEVVSAPATVDALSNLDETSSSMPVSSSDPTVTVTGLQPGQPGRPTRAKHHLFANRRLLIAVGSAVVVVVIAGGFTIGHFIKRSPQVVTSSANLDQNTFYIDSEKQTVGVKTDKNPDGLQVGATVTSDNKGTANVRLGLIKGTDPSILFEDSQKNAWQVLASGGSFQFVQGTTTRAKLDANALSLTNAINVGSDANVAGNTTLGSNSGNTVTIQAASVSTPNNLNFNNNTLMVEASKGSVAIGANTASGYKLLVAGSLKVNSNITTDGQVLAAPGSAKNPGLTFNNNSNTGIYEPSLNAVGVAAGGAQVLQVQQGNVYTVNSANIEADGYLRGGRGASNPPFQAVRFTGTLDGSGSATISDGMSTGYARVLLVQGFYRGNSNEAIPLNVDYVNGGNFVISGGVAGRQYRVTMFYSSDNAGW